MTSWVRDWMDDIMGLCRLCGVRAKGKDCSRKGIVSVIETEKGKE